MASNSMGNIFRITTWGESHGPAMGVVIDGCPPGVKLSEALINEALAARAPGRHALTSPRKEPDQAQLLSGVFKGKTLGTPIAILIPNQVVDSSKYAQDAVKFKPGHAQYAYHQKYGHLDHRGGGRASARETVCRVAAAAVARQLLVTVGIQCSAYLHSLGDVALGEDFVLDQSFGSSWSAQGSGSGLPCLHEPTAEAMTERLQQAMAEGDSLGGVVGFQVQGLPAGLGDPVYEKLEANLAKAMLSIPASKGFEVGEGFKAASMQGSAHNDAFVSDSDQPMASNHAGGTLGGISTGMPLLGRVAFKPTSSIKKAQQTVDRSGQATTYQLAQGSKHDPCVAIRAVPVVRAMCDLVLADAWLMQQTVRVWPEGQS